MEARDGQRAASFDLARDAAVIECAFGLQCDVGLLRIALVAFLDRRLHRAQFTCIHGFLPYMPWGGNLQARYSEAQGRLPPHGCAGSGMFDRGIFRPTLAVA